MGERFSGLRRRKAAAFLCVFSVFAFGCGGEMGADGGAYDGSPGGADASMDAGTDAAAPPDDGGFDAGGDAEDAGGGMMDAGGVDAGGGGTDAGGGGTDAGGGGTDAGGGGTDAGGGGMDAGGGGMDAGTDSGTPVVDAGFDAGFDAGTDAGFDAGLMDHSGTYTTSIGTVIDPCTHRPFTGSPPSTLTITRTGPGMYTITGASPWVTLSGTIDETTGAANLSGTGTVAGFTGVSCTFVGTISGGMLMGTLTWGAANELPACAMDASAPDYSIKFMLTGSR